MKKLSKSIPEKLKNARIAAGKTQKEVADRLGVTPQAISNYERGTNKIENDVLFSLCMFYGVEVSEILSDIYKCPICGLLYDSTSGAEVRKHAAFHKAFTNAEKKYGFCYPDSVSLFDKKMYSYGVVNDKDAPIEDRLDAALSILKIYFSRSLRGVTYDLRHPDFPAYVSMLLNSDKWASTFGQDVYDALVHEYGKRDGIPRGRSEFSLDDCVLSPGIKGRDKSQMASILETEIDGMSKEQIQRVIDFASGIKKSGNE